MKGSNIKIVRLVNKTQDTRRQWSNWCLLRKFWGKRSSTQKLTCSQTIIQEWKNKNIFRHSRSQNINLPHTLSQEDTGKYIPTRVAIQQARRATQYRWNKKARELQEGCWKIKMKMITSVTTLRGDFTVLIGREMKTIKTILNSRKNKKLLKKYSYSMLHGSSVNIM